MFHPDYEYLDLLDYVLHNGMRKDDRTGTGTLSSFGHTMSFELDQCFPLLTSKKIYWPGVVWELLWFVEGRTNVRWLQDRGVRIWDEWADENGNLGPVYGAQWRDWNGTDQLQNVVERLQTHPDCRRHIVSAWNVDDLPKMALPPCHMFYQFYVRGDKLDCQMYQRSCDLFLGCGWNLPSYSLLTHMVAHIVGLKPGRFIWQGGDCHIYLNHIEQVKKQLSRRQELPDPPQLRIKSDAPKSLDGWDIEHFELIGYKPLGKIPAKVSV